MHELHLADSPAEAFRRLHKDSIQRKVRRAEREGLRYDEGRSEKLIDEFYRLLLLTRRRQHLPPQPLSWFHNLADCMGESLKVRAAYKNGEAVASIITLQFKHSLAYKYGTSDLAHQNLGGVHMLLWRSIEEAIEQGLKVFDLGRTDMDNDGLATFKERWGASRGLLSYWIAPPTSNLTARPWRNTLVRRILARVPDRLLSLSGRFIYRHFG